MERRRAETRTEDEKGEIKIREGRRGQKRRKEKSSNKLDKKKLRREEKRSGKQ